MMRFLLKLAILGILVLIFLYFNSQNQQIITGKCYKVHDGDTVSVQADKSYRIRLSGIDAPELKQDYGEEAKDLLTELTLNRTVAVNVLSEDKYGRLIGVVQADDIDVGKIMLRRGAAWHYKKYNDSDEYAELERAAYMQRLGLWRSDKPIPPWKFRIINRKER